MKDLRKSREELIREAERIKRALRPKVLIPHKRYHFFNNPNINYSPGYSPNLRVPSPVDLVNLYDLAITESLQMRRLYTLRFLLPWHYSHTRYREKQDAYLNSVFSMLNQWPYGGKGRYIYFVHTQISGGNLYPSIHLFLESVEVDNELRGYMYMPTVFVAKVLLAGREQFGITSKLVDTEDFDTNAIARREVMNVAFRCWIGRYHTARSLGLAEPFGYGGGSWTENFKEFRNLMIDLYKEQPDELL